MRPGEAGAAAMAAVAVAVAAVEAEVVLISAEVAVAAAEVALISAVVAGHFGGGGGHFAGGHFGGARAGGFHGGGAHGGGISVAPGPVASMGAARIPPVSAAAEHGLPEAHVISAAEPPPPTRQAAGRQRFLAPPVAAVFAPIGRWEDAMPEARRGGMATAIGRATPR